MRPRRRLAHIASALGGAAAASSSTDEPAAAAPVLCGCGCGEAAQACGCPAAVEALAAAESGRGSAAAPPRADDGAEAAADLDSVVVTEPSAPLTQSQVDHFLLDGYVALPGIVPDGFNAELMASVDELMDARAQHTIGSGDWSNGLIAGFGQLGALCSWPPIVEKVKQLMAEYGNGRVDCGMHHIHAARQDAGVGPSPWHQDYMLRPPVLDRAQLHIHVFFYFNGLNGEVGDLMVLPKSQYSHWESSALGQIFGDTPVPGSKVFDSLPNGSAVICHSGLVHGRRQKPGGHDHPRYFVDVSYCQPGDFLTTNRMGRKQAELELAKEKNLHRDGEYMHLWDVEGVVMSEGQQLLAPAGEAAAATGEVAMAARREVYREQVSRQTKGAIRV